jgi:hypothetical protein
MCEEFYLSARRYSGRVLEIWNDTVYAIRRLTYYIVFMKNCVLSCTFRYGIVGMEVSVVVECSRTRCYNESIEIEEDSLFRIRRKHNKIKKT